MDLNTLRLSLSIAGILGIVFFIRLAANSTKKIFPAQTLVYSLLLLMVFGSLRFINLAGVTNAWLNFTIFQGILFLLGIIHTYFSNTKFFAKTEKGFMLGLVYTLGMTVLGAVVMLFVFHYTNRGIPENAGFTYAILLFPLPYLAWHTFDFFLSIPPPLYKGWPFPIKEEDEPDIDMSLVKDTVLLTMIITPKAGSTQPKKFLFKAPVDFRFKEFFYASVSEFNRREDKGVIEIVNSKDQQPYYWSFSLKSRSFWGILFNKERLINPELTIIQSEISSNDTIVCRRIPSSGIQLKS